MVFLDWHNPEEYAFTHNLSGAQWAWEFLRRNRDYRQEWAAFNEVWQALEAAYGRPPDRDFCAWKADPRAWVKAADCPASDCRVDQDKVLIECAMGARWGFYKFPPDPADDDPVGEGRLAWRETERDIPVVSDGDSEWLGDDEARVALGFDLTLPLREQLERAKRTLQVMQRQRQRSGRVVAKSSETLREALCLMLRLLDAELAHPDTATLESVSPDWRALLDQAQVLRDGAYRRLPTLPP